MKAMILSAGRGERMRPLTDHTPKPLLAANGKPLIEHTIESLVAAGFTELVVNTAHLGELIRKHLGDGSAWGARIAFSDEGDGALETGGGIHRALPLLGTEPFLVVNGDVATDFPYQTLLNRSMALAHLILIPNPAHHPGGDFGLDDDQVVNRETDRHTFSGIGVYRPELFASCQPGKFPLAPLLRQAMVDRQVSGELFAGFWMDIGTPERLHDYERHLRSRHAG